LLFRDEPDLGTVFSTAASQLKCPAQFVEKDYWISEILRTLVSEFGDLIIFKGGTSLSKAHKLISRFSEDVDVLLDGTQKPSTNSRRKTISNIRKCLEKMGTFRVSTESQAEQAGKFACEYDSKLPDEFDNTFPHRVIVETGFRGGTHPANQMQLNAILVDLKPNLATQYADLTPFEIRVLAPERTCLEKIYAIHDAFSEGNIDRKTRHFADLDKLFTHDGVQQFLASERLKDLAKDIEANSLEHFNETKALNDVLSSPVFNLVGKSLEEVARGHERDKHLYYAGYESFDGIYARVTASIVLVKQKLSQ
jgi:predicted nucleotidyltransferase component of viral defense system